MEAHEDGSQNKAHQLIQKNKALFKGINFTCHQVGSGEAKTKGSNVNWAIQHLFKAFEELEEKKKELMVTVIDADSWVPKEYFMEMERRMQENPKYR